MDRKFTDAQGEEWDLTLTVGDIEGVKDDCDFDLLSVVEPDLNPVATLHDDLALRFRVVESICRSQYESKSLTAKDFARRMNGPALKSAFDALIKALDFFFRESGRTTNFLQVVNKLNRGAEMLMETLSNRCESLTDESLREMFENSVGSAAGS